ncbi:chromate efflux transporter [Roseivivax sp. CAU 1761]
MSPERPGSAPGPQAAEGAAAEGAAADGAAVEASGGDRPPGRAAEVFAAFARLGLTSFGGPIAHIGYFHAEFVLRRRWLGEAAFADLVALCQFLPGPASSQVGFAIGLLRAGLPGALAAFAAFTAPSAVALVLFAFGAAHLGGPLAEGALAGLKIVAVAIVAQAVLGMARSLCPDLPRAAIAVLAVAVLAALPGGAGMVAAIAAGAAAGLALIRPGPHAGGVLPAPISRRTGRLCLALFALFFVALPLTAPLAPALAVFDAFFRAGALVFGGGHVVLPLLEAAVVPPGWIDRDTFLAGYGAAQAVPGPLFTFAAYLGALIEPGPNGLAGAGLALLGVFLPGALLLLGVLPRWSELRGRPRMRAALAGTNAAVVGILGAALHDPVFVSAVHGRGDLALALGCFVLLTLGRQPPWRVVLLAAAAGAARTALG